MRYHLLTQGCQMNVSESLWLAQALENRGWRQAPEDQAQVFVLNTCSVRDKPEQKVYSILGRLARYCRQDPQAFVAVGGCVAQQVGQDFWRRFPHVRLVFGPDGVGSVPDCLQRLLQEPGLRLSLLDFSEHYPERSREFASRFTPAQAYVNIMQGCDNFCAYCIVPYTRGRQRSRQSQEVIKECQDLVSRGVKEINLLGQNVNSYGLDSSADGVTFVQLLHRVCAIPGLQRVRFTTSHPKDIPGELIQAFGSLPNLCPGLHLPLQSGSNKVLYSMGRKYTRQQYLWIVQELRRHCPHLALSTDLIVGFPGEEEADFQQTMDMVGEVGFSSSFSFKYCDRPGVRAASFQGKLSEEVKSRRLQELQALQEEITARDLQEQVGRRLEILVEGSSSRQQAGEAWQWKGREPGGRVVNFSWGLQEDLHGCLLQVRIKEAKKHSLWGEVIQQYDRNEDIRLGPG
ncbi:MAG: tRNA (N6-isopentenyl adenosine(37)-C2)-methylthiotransferase MiaB [Desulfohalobiaceae bacterium]